jgi:hypothetical protein
MANAVYPLWLRNVLDVWMNLASANPAGSLRVAAVTDTYVYTSAHEFYSSVSGVLATATLASVTTTGGVLDAADTALSGLSAGVVDALVIHWWTGAAGTSRLMLYIDEGIGFGVDPSGDPTIIWPNDVNGKIYPLAGRAA